MNVCLCYLPGRKCCLLILLLYCVVFPATAAKSARELLLVPGGIEVLEHASRITRVALADADVIEGRQLDDTSLLLIAKSDGYSEMKVWTEDALYRYQINVRQVVEPKIAVPVIELEVQVVEFKSRQLQSLGIRWQHLANGPSVGIISDWLGGNDFRVESGLDFAPTLESGQLARGHYAYAGLITSFRSQLQALNEQGQARMLATPTLRTESGQTAEFLAGGEVPLPQANTQGALDVTFRSYGVGLKISPLQLDDGTIRTHVLTEVSNLDPAVSVQGIPGLLTRRTESVVAVAAEQTFVISGLRSEDHAITEQRVPGVQLAPLIGPLFRHRESQRQETELVIFITPRVVGEYDQRQQQRHQRVMNIRQQLRLQPCRGMQSYE